MDLIEERDDLAVEINFWVSSLENPLNTVDIIGDLCEEISEKYRALAICRLLADADTDGFYHDLLRSAKIREYYLLRSRAENYLDFHMASSRSQPFFDAIAVNTFELARNIMGLSSQDWLADDEYEDDFCYVQFLHKYISFDEGLQHELNEILQRFETSLQGATSARLEICKAFLMKNQGHFDNAFNSLIEERSSEIKNEKERFVMEDINIIVNRHVFVEGLALLNISEKAGLQTQNEYLFCPRIARLPMIRPFPNDGYVRL